MREQPSKRRDAGPPHFDRLPFVTKFVLSSDTSFFLGLLILSKYFMSAVKVFGPGLTPHPPGKPRTPKTFDILGIARPICVLLTPEVVNLL